VSYVNSQRVWLHAVGDRGKASLPTPTFFFYFFHLLLLLLLGKMYSSQPSKIKNLLDFFVKKKKKITL
jgi:hypothetical protein